MSATWHGVSKVALGLRAQKGGAVVVGVACDADRPRVLLSTVLGKHAPDDRLSLEPYRVASQMPRDVNGRPSGQAIAAVAEGRARQDRFATRALRATIRTLGHEPVVAALLVNRAGWITDLLEHALGWPEHVPVAELLAVRSALRTGLRGCGIEAVELDEKSLPEFAKRALDLPSNEIDRRLKDCGKAAGRPWRKEQKLACLAAWVALVQRR